MTKCLTLLFKEDLAFDGIVMVSIAIDLLAYSNNFYNVTRTVFTAIKKLWETIIFLII